MIYCSNCGSTNKTSSKFCNNCGALLAEPTDVRCAICGSPNKIGSVYCGTCGGRLETHPKVKPEQASTLAPLPKTPLPPASQNWPVTQATQEIATEPPSPETESQQSGPPQPEPPQSQSPQPESQSRRVPEWIARVHSAPHANAAAPGKAADGPLPRTTWLREFHAATEAAPPGDEPVEEHGDWLANLRAAAMIELEAARPEPENSDSEAEPRPVPKWFGYIRPPLGAGTAEPSSIQQPPAGEEQEGDKTPAPFLTREEPEPLQAFPQRESKPLIDKEKLQDWLVQLQSESIATEQAPAHPVEHEPEPEPLPAAAPAIIKRQDIPEWLKELAPPAVDQEPPAEVQADSLPLQAGAAQEPAPTDFEEESGREPDRTREQDLGLPDWLTAPIEAGTLLAQVQDATPRIDQAESREPAAPEPPISPEGETAAREGVFSLGEETATPGASTPLAGSAQTLAEQVTSSAAHLEPVQVEPQPSAEAETVGVQADAAGQIGMAGASPSPVKASKVVQPSSEPPGALKPAPPEIAALHSRTSSRFANLQDRLQILLQRIVAPRETAAHTEPIPAEATPVQQAELNSQVLEESVGGPSTLEIVNQPMALEPLADDVLAAEGTFAEQPKPRPPTPEEPAVQSSLREQQPTASAKTDLAPEVDRELEGPISLEPVSEVQVPEAPAPLETIAAEHFVEEQPVEQLTSGTSEKPAPDAPPPSGQIASDQAAMAAPAPEQVVQESSREKNELGDRRGFGGAS